MKKLLITDARKIERGNDLTPCEILIEGGRIRRVSAYIEREEDMLILEAEGKLVTPGFIDVHVHLREPGYAYKETIHSGSRAGALGGYTTLFAMPNTKPTVDQVSVLQALQEKSGRDSIIRCGFYSSITLGEEGVETVDFQEMNRAGAVGFTDDGKGVQNAGQMYKAMREIAKFDGLVSAHCEEESMLFGGYIHEGSYSREFGHRGIHPLAEDLQILRDAAISEETGCRYHICHMSTKNGVRALRRAREDGVRISGEVTPHHLLLNEMDLREDGNYKMNPPLRSKEDQEELIRALNEGVIEVIATDHAPHSLEEKNRGLAQSSFGIVGLETAFPLLYTHLVRKGRITLERLIDAMTKGPKKVFGLPYGELEAGQEADLTLIDLERKYTIDRNDFISMGRNTPFQGYEVQGKVDTVICQGKVIVRGGKIIEQEVNA